jgi:arylsulfatase A-like enzyme
MIPPYPGPAVNENVDIELGNDDAYQLYNLAEDLEQQKNLAEAQPEKLKAMIQAFEQVRGNAAEGVEDLELK